MKVKRECYPHKTKRSQEKFQDLPRRIWYGFGFHLVEGKCEFLCCSLLLNFLQNTNNKHTHTQNPLLNTETKTSLGLTRFRSENMNLKQRPTVTYSETEMQNRIFFINTWPRVNHLRKERFDNIKMPWLEDIMFWPGTLYFDSSPQTASHLLFT